MNNIQDKSWITFTNALIDISSYFGMDIVVVDNRGNDRLKCVRLVTETDIQLVELIVSLFHDEWRISSYSCLISR